MEIQEEFGCPINYHPGEANGVVDALSLKARVTAIQLVQVLDLETIAVRGR
jgi:hypothetical protein